MKFMEGIGSNWSWTYCSFLFNCGAFCLLLTCRQRHLFSPGWEASVGEFGGKLANSAVSPSGRGCRYLGVALVCGREDRNWDHYGTKKLNISILTGGLSFPMFCSLEVSTQTLLIIGIIDLFSVANSFCSKTIRVAKTGPRHSYLDGEQHSKFHSVRRETPCRSSGGAGFELGILPRQLNYSDHIKKFSQHQYCSSRFPPFHSSGGETGHGFASHLSSSSGCPCCCWATQCRPHQAHHTWASRPCIHGRRNLKVDKSSYSNLDSTEIRMLILPILCRRMSTLPSPQSRPSTSFNTLTGVPFDLRLASTTSYPPLFQVGSSKGALAHWCVGEGMEEGELSEAPEDPAADADFPAALGWSLSVV